MIMSNEKKEKVVFSFSTYGTHKYPVIWIKEIGNPHIKYIMLDDPEDALTTMKTQIENYLENGFEVEWKKGGE
jgi:hypothetical protein